MSLLLDALNRASKDKSAAEAAAQPKATAEWPSISLTALPNESTPSDPSLTLEQPAPASRAAMQSPLQFPTLGLSLEPVLADVPSNALAATADPTVSGRPIEPTLDEEPLLAALGLGLDPMPPAAQSEPAPPQAAAPEPAPEPTATPMAETTPSPPVKPAPANSSAQPSKVAQSIMRAKESTQAIGTPRPRMLALGAVASLLSVSAVSVLMGWIDPLALLGQRSTVGLAATPTAAALTEPASVAVAPMAQQADGTSLPDNNVAASTPPQSRAPAAPVAAKAGKKEAAVTALATATVAPLPSRASPEPASASASASGTPTPAAATSTETAIAPPSANVPASAPAVVLTAAPVPGPAVAVAAAPAKPASGPTTTRPTSRARSATSQAKLSDLPQMLVTAPPGVSKLEQAYAALTQGRLADAASGYKEVLKVNPEERDALLGLAYVSHKEGRDEEARDYYKRVLRQEPGNPTARAGLLIQNLSNDAEDVSATSREVAEQHPGSAAAQSVLGHSLVRQGRLADAQMAFQRAQVLEPSVALHAFNLAVALDRLKSHAMARTFYERALSLSRQSGGEQVSGLPHAVVQQRIDELRLATSSNLPAVKQP